MKLEQIKTPALMVDLDAMEANLRDMANFFAGRRCKLRPHFKNHKAPILAWRQMRAGAIGITCATVREAEILVEHGIDSILIANEISGAEKPEVLAQLARHASVMVAVDNCHSVRDLAAAQRNRKSQIEVLVDVNIGLNRCGVEPGQAALDLARYATEHGLAVRGIMGYEGHLQAVPPSPERDEVVRRGTKAIVDSAALLETEGISASIRSTGGTRHLRRGRRLCGYHRNPGRVLPADGQHLCQPACAISALAHRAGNGDQYARSRTRHSGLRCESRQRRAGFAHLKRCSRGAFDGSERGARDRGTGRRFTRANARAKGGGLGALQRCHCQSALEHVWSPPWRT